MRRSSVACTAKGCGFATDKLVFEITETERIRDTAHVVRIIKDYQRRGFLTAIDDFSAGDGGGISGTARYGHCSVRGLSDGKTAGQGCTHVDASPSDLLEELAA